MTMTMFLCSPNEDTMIPLRLDEFLKQYSEDDNAWWALSSGDHQNLFDQALDEIDSLRADLALCARMVDDGRFVK